MGGFMRRILAEYKRIEGFEVDIFDCEGQQRLGILSQAHYCTTQGGTRVRIHCVFPHGKGKGRDYHVPRQSVRVLFDHQERLSHLVIRVYPRRGRRRLKCIIASVSDGRMFLLPGRVYVDERE